MSQLVSTAYQSMPVSSYVSIDSWSKLRDPEYFDAVKSVIEESAPSQFLITNITHVRTAHYVACRVDGEDKAWLARAGISMAEDTEQVSNTGYLGTSVNVPSGQSREYRLANDLAEAKASVAVPEHYENFDSVQSPLDVLWVPFLEDSCEAVTAVQWAEALKPIHDFRPRYELPVFTNRAKTFARLESMDDRQAARNFMHEYDDALKRLFRVATQWGTVHGDAHCGNVLINDGKPVIFDFDTVCWAPTVWDLTHLLTRVGTERNTGYTAEELISEFDFTDKEIDAAITLRNVARRVARAVR